MRRWISNDPLIPREIISKQPTWAEGLVRVPGERRATLPAIATLRTAEQGTAEQGTDTLRGAGSVRLKSLEQPIKLAAMNPQHASRFRFVPALLSKHLEHMVSLDVIQLDSVG